MIANEDLAGSIEIPVPRSSNPIFYYKRAPSPRVRQLVPRQLHTLMFQWASLHYSHEQVKLYSAYTTASMTGGMRNARKAHTKGTPRKAQGALEGRPLVRPTPERGDAKEPPHAVL